MPKKTPNNRLKSLFTSLDAERSSRTLPEPHPSPSTTPSAPQPTKLSTQGGWSWECDQFGFYTYCSDDVTEILGIAPERFSEQSIYEFAIHPDSSRLLRREIQNGFFPLEMDIRFKSLGGNWIPVKMTLYANYGKPNASSSHPANTVETSSEEILEITGYHGFNLLIPSEMLPSLDSEHPFEIPPRPSTPPSGLTYLGRISSVALTPKGIERPTSPWTDIGKRVIVQTPEKPNLPGTDLIDQSTGGIAVPFSLSDRGLGVLEVVDDASQRSWSDDEKLLIQEVTNQLALALENARLYAAAQEELSERIRAQQETLRRNKDLASLNQIGQRLSRLTSSKDIFSLVEESILNLIDNHNIIIATLEQTPASSGIPANLRSSNIVIQLASREHVPDENVDVAFVEQITKYALQEGRPIILNKNTPQTLSSLGIKNSVNNLEESRISSLLCLPLKAGERNLGAIILHEPKLEGAFSEIEVELLSTIATQTTSSLENAYLFQEITNALAAIETRERYQANVAKSVASLTELGTRALPDVMASIGTAAQNSRVYFAQVHEDESGTFWQITSQWISPQADSSKFDSGKGQHIPVALYSHWLKELREKGYCATPILNLPSAEREYLNSQGIKSSLLLAVPGKSSTPGFIALDQVDHERQWLNEEINVLQVAANGISNTYVREDLLDQLQVSLDETENLYNTSHRLALANTLDEMVTAIIEGVRSPQINRGILILFGTDVNNPQKINSMSVAATWYSGRGVPPPAIGSEILRAVYEKAIVTTAPLFVDDIFEYQLGSSIRDVLAQNNVRSIAILPLASSKKQLGALLLESEDKHRFGGREIRSYPPLVDQMAIAVDNLNLLEQTEKALSETGLLYKISNGVAQAADAQDLVTLITQYAMPKNAERSSILYVSLNAENEPSEVEVIGFHDRSGGYQRMGVRLPAAALPVIKTIGSDVLVYSDIMRSTIDPVSKKTLSQLNILSTCLVPLRSAGRLIGLIITSAAKPVDFSPEEARLLQLVGNNIAVALERQRLLREAQRRALELQTAAEIARDTTSILSRETLLNRIVNLIYGRFGFYHVGIFMLDEEGKYVVVQEASGEAGEQIKSRNYRVLIGSRSIIGTAANTGEPVIVNDVSQSILYMPESLLPDTKSEIGIPLKLGERVIGVLDIQSTRIGAFTQDDLAVLQILADQIAVALENARSYELAQKAYNDIMEVDRVKSQFLANMSHELRTPLNSIIGFSRVIMKGIDGPINDTQKQDLNAIYNSGQHLLALINDILDLSKIEAGKMQLAFTEISIVDVVNSMMSTVTGLLKDKPVKLVQIIPDNLPTVLADQTRIRQVLLNFLSNAAKFTEEGSITVEASLVNHPEDQHTEIMITVTDSGPGIAEEDQHKLFQPFSQVDDSTTRKVGGTGLGLSITRSLIELHKGRIGLAWSELGKGSQFFFTLPVQTPEPEQAVTPAEPTSAQEEKVSKMVLCIDDDPQVIALYDKFLKPQGYQVIALTDPKQALQKARRLKPFAITLDIMMPEKDGWEVLHELKHEAETRNIPVLICSIVEDSQRGMNLGASDYLVKPFMQEDLINAVNRLNYQGNITKILIIDDDEADLRLVKKMLEDFSSLPSLSSPKFLVTTAQGGNEGWEAIQEEAPDAVILDLFMPDINGFTLLEKIRSDEGLRDIPVIILSGADLTPEQHKLLSDFGQQMITKGFLTQNDLLNSLNNRLKNIR